MIWDWPRALLLLWGTPLLVALLVWAERRRRIDAARFIAPAMAPRIYPREVWSRPWTRGVCVTAALVLMIAALARPRWGSYLEVIQPRGLDVFILLDVSRSMSAEDVAPSRLGRAKSDVQDLLEKLQGDRVGLIVFAGKPVLMTPLTTDKEFYRSTLASVGISSAPRGGSRIDEAIRKGVSSFGKKIDRDRVILLISDGEDSESGPIKAAQEALAEGVRIFTVGMGDPLEGGRIPLRDTQGRLTYLKYDGKEVWSKLNERTLEKIANETGGAYIPARTNTYDLGAIYESQLASLARGEVRQETRKEYRDRFQWFLAGGMVLLAIDFWLQGTSASKRIAPSILVEEPAEPNRSNRRSLLLGERSR